MSRISKWKLEKNKVKVVFRLQFHATHIPQTGWDKLFISFIPADTGKPTAKTTKANVRNGSCKWGDPIYETTRLLQDSKSKLYDEKLYKLVVSMGSSRASILGEATINLADYVEASKPTIATLPLHGCNFGTTLHITVQLLTSKTGFREFEQQREISEKGLLSGADGHSDGASSRIPSSDGVINEHTDKASTRIKFKSDVSELSSLEEVNVNEEYADSATGFDGSSNTSGSLYAEKHETTCTHELDSIKCTLSGDVYQSPHAAKDLSGYQNNAQGSTGSNHGWGSNSSMDNELAMASEENNRLRGSLELAESSLFSLKLEVSSLQGVADELGAETLKLSHELAAEISSAEKLAKEVSSMKSECQKFKDDIHGLKNMKLSSQIPIVEAWDDQVNPLVRNVQLQFLNGISAVESKIREFQKKSFVPSDGDTTSVHLELEALLNFLLDLKLGNGALPNILPSDRADFKAREMSQFKDEQFESGNGFGLDLCPPEIILQHLSSIPPASDVVNPLGAADAMKSQIFDLVRELDEAKVEKEALTRKMDQMECYYEALIHELEENQKGLLGELQLLRNEHSTCLYALSVSKTEVESLREEMNEHMLRSVQERRDMEAINLELERRATTSEAALRRARLNYSIAVDKLQKDLELLSSQVTSMFESNENLIKQALPSQPVSQIDRELVQNPEDNDVAKSTQSQNQNLGLRKRSGGGDILLDDLKRSVCMQEDLYRKVEEELIEMYSISLNLDIYSKALEESLCETNADLKIMNGKLSELVEELTNSTASQSNLMRRLQKATEEIHTLNEYKSSSISQCSEMRLQNQLLEDKLLSVSEENYLLSQKLIDLESTLLELRSCQSKYAACSAENAELMLQLKHESLESEKLLNEMSFLKEELKNLKAESDELVSSKRNLEESVKFVQDKSFNLLSSYTKQFGILAGSQSFNFESVDMKDALLRLEEVHHSASIKVCQLMEENQSLKCEKASADESLSTVRSEILLMKQKFKSGVQDIVMKLDLSDAVVDRLQAGIELVANKLLLSSEIEEKFAEQNELLLADFVLLEDQMQKLTSRNGHLAREISNLDSLAEELGRSQLEITELIHVKQELTECLMDKTDESMKLSHEVDSLKEDLKTLRDKFHNEKASTDALEIKVRDLSLCLSKGQDKLLEFEQQKAELVIIRERASHLEMEKSKLDNLLHQQNELMEELKKSSSYQDSLESQLSEMHDYSLTTDFQLIYVSNQYKALLNEFVQKLAYSEKSLRDLKNRFHDTESMLNLSLASEASWRQEKDSLLACLEGLKSDVDVSEAQNKLLLESNIEIKNQLEESNGCLRDLQKRHHETESTMNHSLAGEANWRQEKDSLLASLESLRSDLEASEAQNKLLYKSNNEIKDHLEECKGCLSDLQKSYRDTESILSNNEDKWRQEKDGLLASFESLKSDLEASESQSMLLSESNKEIRDHLEECKGCLRDLQKRYHDTESMLNQSLADEDNWRQEKDSLLTTLESLKSDLEASESQNKLLSESNKDIKDHLDESKGCLRDLQKRYHDTESMLNHCVASEDNWRREKNSLLASLESLRSDLKVSEAQNRLLSESNNEIRDELEESKSKLSLIETHFPLDSSRQASDILPLQNTIVNVEEEMSNLILSKNELEIYAIVLKCKVVEQTSHITLLEGYKEEMMILRFQFNELSKKLSEQVLKTEEFKNLSVHLKELKDKAEAECAACEKRENEVPSATVQDSLRIAFIKEQYETKVQELTQLLSVSKKHGEDMLMRLQDAIDEIENRKKSEAVSMKKNEELSTRLSVLEAELTSVLSEKREKSNAYDRIKAELECALLSLECCKEEKEKLGASLSEFEAEKSHLADELTFLKGQLEDLKCSTNLEKDEYGSESEVEHAHNGSTGDSSPVIQRGNFIMLHDRENAVPAEPVSTLEGDDTADSTEPVKFQMPRDADPDLQGNGNTSDVNNKHLGVQKMRSSIERLHEELEKMKNENAFFDIEHELDTDLQATQREISQLHKANEELRCMFPLFDEISSGGNALDRVLALEIELAEALKVKNKSNNQFQSSFLKQHSDEEAVLKSFRDINELIKEMLELKGRHNAVEAELRQMHDRYSQLSLQFAEVEGERQKLKMTLKNVRASKRLVHLSRSSSDNLMDHPS